ncbi:TPA: molecular chaperone [Citrobacter sedlakii]|nr:molecular chaperone [Citrobacter sedlakii]
MFNLCRLLLACFLAVAVHNTYATVTVGGTRVLYDGSKKEISFSVRNPDNTPYLIQAVIDDLQGGLQKPPFIITPPLYRLNSGKENLMRIVLTGSLPQNIESMYWLRVKAIPSAPREKNTLQIAVETNIKLIYRPEKLKGMDVETESNKLSWHISGDKLEVKNPSACFINFNMIEIAGKKLQDVSWVSPESITTFNLPEGVKAGTLQYSIISDYGAIGKIHSISLNG